MEKPTCETCPYYEAYSEKAVTGNCCRRAPIVRTTLSPCGDFDHWSTFPQVDESEWCGEHPDFGKRSKGFTLNELLAAAKLVVDVQNGRVFTRGSVFDVIEELADVIGREE